MLACQGQDFLVEGVLDVAQLFDRPDFFAECVYIGKELLLFARVHEDKPPFLNYHRDKIRIM